VRRQRVGVALRIFPCDSEDDHLRCLGIRRAVFCHEQGVPEALEVDDEERCRHFLAVVRDAEREHGAVATARLLPLGDDVTKLQRMAVLSDWRGLGIGRALLAEIEAAALERGLGRITLDAQLAAVPFYQRAGYRVSGEEQVIAGIPHRSMAKDLDGGCESGSIPG